MAQRLNKKLLLGLGSSLGFLGTGVVSGFGVNAIVNNLNDNNNISQFAAISEADFKTAPDYNVAKRDMFIDTTNLKRFHFGNTQLGQSVTPWGWLGVFEDSQTKKNRIALTSWSGEVLWVNEDYKSDNTDRYNVYDMKYDFNTNLIAVVRTPSSNGLLNDDGTRAFLQIDLLDAKTGVKKYDGFGNANTLINFQNSFINELKKVYFDNPNPSTNEWRAMKNRWTNLFHLDIASRGPDGLLISYIPDFLRLMQKKVTGRPISGPDSAPVEGSNTKKIKLVNLKELSDSWQNMAISFRIQIINGQPTGHWSRRFWLRKAAHIDPNQDRFIGTNNTSLDGKPLSDFFLLANPFFTISDAGNFVLHLFFANEDGKIVLHKTVTFKKDGGNSDGDVIRGSEVTQRFQDLPQHARMNVINTDKTFPSNISQVGSWGFADKWNETFVNANLIPNKNIFDNHSVVLAYPFASNSNSSPQYYGLPIFNVIQLEINGRDASGGSLIWGNTPDDGNLKKTWNFNLGSDILDYYTRNNGSYASNNNLNDIYPWPTRGGDALNTNNFDRFYNRLISVSPFDNSFIFAAKANVRANFLEQTQTRPDQTADFWLANINDYTNGLTAVDSSKRFIRPLLISNSTTVDTPIELRMTNFKSLYVDGFTFDINSFSINSNNGENASLNLYFNQNGSDRNFNYQNNGFLSSKIGLIENIFDRDKNLWTNNIANPTTLSGSTQDKINKIKTNITQNSYSTLIYSRANLETWFPRTWLNSNNASNLQAANSQLNEAASVNTRAIATRLDQRLGYDNKSGVDLVTNWTVNNAAPPAYNRLSVQRPVIKVRSESIENKLPIETTYPLARQDDLYRKGHWAPTDAQKANLVFTTRQDLPNTSYQILSSWKNQVRIDSIGNLTNNAIASDVLNIRETHTFGGNPQWFDARKPGAQVDPFGKVNNEILINNINPLRVVLKIAKPTGTLPGWFNTIDNNRFFETKYPLAKDALPNETTFQEIIQSFLAEKAQRIDLAQNNDNVAVGFGNLRIDAYLDLNPRVINNANLNNSKIFTNGNKRILTLNDGQRIIYEDLYTDPYHEIYDQSAISYTDFNNWGFGKDNTDVRARVQTSWTSNLPQPGTKINTKVNYSLLADKLVRFSPGDTANVFDFDYASANPGELELTPTNLDWFKNHFFNFNRLINLFVQFEYQLSGQNTWNALGSFYTDEQLQQAFNTTTNKLTLSAGVVPNISKLRFKLTSKATNAQNDPNHFVELDRFTSTDNKYISKAHDISAQKVVVDNGWFNEITLSSNDFLQNINAAVFQTYEDTIFAKSPSFAQSNNLRQQVKLVYQWPGESTWIEGQEMADLIKSKLNFTPGQWTTTDQGVWSLSNGNNNPGGFTIKAKFAKTSANSNVQFTNAAGTTLNDNQLSGDVKANIQTKVELGPWLDFLKSQKITAQKGNANGVLVPSSLVFPDMSGAIGSAQFAGRPFDFIQQLLSNAGIRMRFKRWDANQGTWSNWLDSINDLNTYNPSDPKIAIGFRIDNPNVAVKNNNADFTNDSVIELNLNLPKLVKAPVNTQQMIDQFNQQNPFSGNTFNLEINDAGLTSAQQQVINALKTASQSGNNAAGFATLDNALDFKYQLGNSTFSDANALKTFLAQQANIDQADNTLKLQISIKASHVNEYQLDASFPSEFTLQPNNNTVIKKWIHGTVYEAALARQDAVTLSPNSSKNNLQYNYHSDLQTLFTGAGREGLVVQWSLGSNPNTWNDLKNGQNPLPTSVAANENNIRIRIAKEANNQIYLYGPEQSNQQRIFTLDLSQIPTPIEIDNNWFNQLTLSVGTNQFLQNIDGQHFTNYENQFFANSNSLNGNNNAALRAKVKLEYQFNKSGNWMDAAQIAADIRSRLNNFNASDQGVFTLSHDGTTYNGNAGLTKFVFVINARVVKAQPNDATIQFVSPNNPNQTIGGSQLEGNLKSDIQTKIDLGSWLNELLTAGISATRGQRPGELDGSTIQIPGKTSANPQVQFGGKSFTEIQRILNNVNVFVQYKKYDAAANDFWSGWLDNQNSIDTYNVQNPQIVIGFKTPQTSGTANDRIPLNVKVFNGQTEFTNDTPFTVKLNVPKLVKQPQNLATAIQDFNAQNAFGGNTFNLDVNNNQLNVAQNGFTNAIKLASEANGRYDDLDNFLIYEYQIMNSGSDWKSAADLKTFLATKLNVDLDSNQLKFRIRLQAPNNGQSPEYELDPNQNWEFDLLPDNNPTIKKYLHGQQIEADLAANRISVTGSKNQLQYTFNGDLAVFQNNGQDTTKELILQYRLFDKQNQVVGNGANQGWTNGALPNQVAANVQRIQVRVAHNSAGANIFVYGPELNQQQAVANIDLSQIATVITIDKTWLEANPIVNTLTDSQNINEAQILAWEEQIWAQIPEARDPEIKQKMIIKYQFAQHNGLTAQNLFSTINNELTRFDDQTHHGIVKLHDKNAPGTDNGFKIKATIEKATANDPTITFIDPQGTNIDDDAQVEKRSGIVDTSNISTTLNLTDWIKNLMDQKTVVNTNSPGTITSLEPPSLAGAPNSKLFAGQIFNDIERWLKEAQVNLWWNDDPQNANGWKTTDQIKTYDPRQAKLWFALNNDSSNLILNLGNGLNQLMPKTDNRANPITINLDAPKEITINPPVDAARFQNHFSGNTKYLNVQTNEIQKGLEQILANLGPQFAGAPLTLMVQVGDEAAVDYKVLAQTLKGKTTDVASGLVTVNFAIDQSHPDAAQFSINNGGDAQVSLITDPSIIKVFVNDQGIFDQLKTAQLNGNNTNFNVVWPNNWTVDATTGVLNALNKQGLRLEFSFNNLAQDSPVVGNDPNQQWVRQIPTQYQLSQKKIYVRIQTTTANFVYERIASNENNTEISPQNQPYKFELDLNLTQIINLDGNWLNQVFSTTNIELANLNAAHFSAYETLVKNNIQEADEIKNKVAINYSFNGQENLDKNALIQAINIYQQAFNDETKNFGLLQLWNQQQGQQIKAKFVKANPTDTTYDLDVRNQNEHILDSSKVLTTINLQAVLNWLTTIQVEVVPETNVPNSIKNLKFPPIAAPNDRFDQKTWSQLKTVLANFGLNLQFRTLTAANSGNDDGWVNSETELKTYDPTIGKIQIRFRFETNKATNVKAQLEANTILEGNQNQPSKAFDVQLKIKLLFEINRQHTDAFFNDPDSIRGNTKNLIINEQNEKRMIDTIKAENAAKNPEFAKAKLYVGYQLGDGQIGGQWKKRTDFINELAQATNDQNTNKVVYRLLIEEDQSDLFETPEVINVLHNFESPANGIKIPYFINAANWEANAAKLAVTGTSSNLNWNFEAVFGAGNFIERNNGVYLRNAAGEALQMFFTTNPNATYDEPVGFGQPNEINSRWVSTKPTSLNAATTTLKIKLVALNSGFIYEPAVTTPKTALAHDVNIAIKREIIVDKSWFTEQELSPNALEISAFVQNAALMEQWENQIYEKIVTRNQIDLNTAKKVQIKYLFGDENQKMSAAELRQHITSLQADFEGPKLGLVQLWNNVRGDKIKAIFVSGDNDFVVRTENNPQPNETELQELVKTNNIYTSISLVEYINVLKTTKTNVDLKQGGQAGEITNFTPPAMIGAANSGPLNGKEYARIAQRLNDLGVQIKFAKTATDQAAAWVDKNQIDAYDIQLSALFLSFEIDQNETNVRAQIDALTTLEPGQNLRGTKAIRLPLNVPKYIIIDQTQPLWQTHAQDFDFNGDTKNLRFNQSKIEAFVQAILQNNVDNSGDQDYLTAPLEIHFQVGDLAFIKISELKDYLQQQTVDLTDRRIRFKLVIPADQDQNWKLEAPETEYELFQQNDPLLNKIKIFVNDNGKFNQLKAMLLQGTQNALIWPWPWPNGGIDEISGVLTPSTGGFGKGLKLQFSFNSNANSEGTNVETSWVGQVPKSFKSQYDAIYVRIQLTDANLYTYQFINQPFSLSLTHIQKTIKLDSSWLEQQLNTGQPLELNLFNLEQLNQYEQVVLEAAQNDPMNPVAVNLLDKFKIEYQLEGNQQWVDKATLITLIDAYQANNNQSSLGILQFWNNNVGLKIKVRFADANVNDNYQIEFIDSTGQNEKIINTSNILTTVDLRNVLSWLGRIKVRVNGQDGVPNSIQSLEFGSIEAAGDSHFNNKTWNQFKTALAQFGINLQFRSLTLANIGNENADWVDSESDLNTYDPAIGKIQIRFKFDNAKALNMKLQLDNELVLGTQSNPTKAFDVQLKIRLIFQIDNDLVNQFITSTNVISGNTKNLMINAAAEQTMIAAIKAANAQNNPEFTKAQLKVGYQIGDGQIGAQWLSRTEFLAQLSQATTDQSTNQIVFQFYIDPSQEEDFGVANDIYTLHQKEVPSDQTLIPYFVNTRDWETKADQVIITGTSSNLNWNFSAIFGPNTVIEENGKVYLKNVTGAKALQVYFTTKADADYTNPDLSEDINELNSKWVAIKPTNLNAATKNLKIKLVAGPGFVYEAAQNPISATAHNVQIKIQREIIVDKNWFTEQPLTNNEIEISTFIDNPVTINDWENQIYNKIVARNQIDLQTAQKIKIKYIYNDENSQFDAAGLLNHLRQLKNNFNLPSMGLVQLWDGIRGDKIKAIFVSEDPEYILKTDGTDEPTENDLKELVTTTKIYTSVSLVTYINELKQTKTEVTLKPNGQPGEITDFTPPKMPGTPGQGPLSGYSYEQIANRLQELGINVKFAKTASDNANDWVEKSAINAYDIQTSALFLSFEVATDALNAKVQSSTTETINPGQNMRGNKAVKLPLNVPKYIIIDESKPFWLNIKQEFDFNGNTKNINFNQDKIDQFIEQILNQNYIDAGNDNDYKSAPLKIKFQVGNEAFVEMEQLKGYLAGLNDDLTNRSIHFKFSIPEDQANQWKLEDPNKTYTLLTENDQVEISKLKIYINDKGIFKDLEATKLKGTSQNLQWEFQNQIQVNETTGVLSAINRGVGLKVEFTFNENLAQDAAPGADVNNDWVSQMPKSFAINQTKVFIRLALTRDDLYHYDQKYQKIELSLSDIVRVLNLQSAWLKTINLSGNTKNLNIDETQALNFLQSALPADKPNLVQLKYSIDGQTWRTKDEFKAFLISQNGQKDEANFILKREDLQVRFELDQAETARFQMTVDNVLIQPDNSDSPASQLINDQATPTLNETVRGVIELKNLKHFIKENFAIQGSNTNPRLVISKRTEIDSLLQIYATDQLFDIKITGVTTNGAFDWNRAVSILDNKGKLIDENGLNALGFVLDGNKKVALRFESRHNKYDIYQNSSLQTNGYVLDISDNVNVTFEITNPFTAQSKTLSLWWTMDRDKTKAKYNQGQGGFKVVNGINDLPDTNDYIASADWLQSADSGLSDKEKQVLEFVYHIYDGEPTTAEINQVSSKEEINNYAGTIWKSLDQQLATDGSNFTQNLNLKVGQYVSVALRVKQEYASGDDIYTLKDNDHSFVRPISLDGQNRPGRAHGYQVNVDDVNIDQNQIVLDNMIDSEQPPLDGYTNIKRLNLIKDANQNYLGVNLKIQLFHEFHKGLDKKEVIITPFDKIKLVKRDPGNSVAQDYFKDANGNQIMDETGQPIPILVDDQGKPNAPIMSADATIERNFDSYQDGFFGLSVPIDVTEKEKWGIFKNETIKIVFSANEGQGGAAEPDFILNKAKEVDLKDQISPQIKFPIFNQENIRYDFNHEDFKKDQIEFVNALKPEQTPTDGKSKVKTLIKLTKIKADNSNEIITGNNETEVLNNLMQELQTSFKGKLRFETIYEQVTGARQIYETLEVYKLNQLKNGDRIKVNIVSNDPDFIWAQPPKTLAFQVSGLTTKAPERNKLQYLRVEQNGLVDGQGSFKVLVNNPTDVNSDTKDILDGWKFVLRVWNSAKTIKHNWTAEQEKINNLENGDKVEWKLLDEFNNPVEDAYYNTVAGEHQFDATTGQTIFNFKQVNYPNGKESAETFQEGIGDYPTNSDAYPEDSGFVISGLKDALEIFEISDAAFAKVMTQLEPHYVGFNGQGTINFKEDYLSKNYYVNSLGELYEKPFDQPTFKQQVDDSVVEISLADFLANTTFYTSDPNLINYQNGFKFLGNDTNLNNHLSNGDQVWAQFDLQVDNNEVNRGISTELNPVTGLQELLTDPMTPLWYILMAIGGVVTLGGLSLLFLWIKRNRKLKR